mmetsp:Transcript_40040/g.58902  ORF Transcript_40040/g.58902 Transcript_40040/m.58902 type:complete len:438 (+) Transcript_40040:53-1366(+)|eukprot:CAMPEP_0195507708 /NCGR_PEP_ID=MMETSP0794_2-20130614/1102_1 /TAXON_ID=515487 /ORGANISM="Stephanopyxis turris, Strain CCMP 815" /LENGTH=437 /DNA_ID=CAMNT_0040634481 /DNA_START=41 /DNA_END=1354 /DNA_ORIENTATION=+
MMWKTAKVIGAVALVFCVSLDSFSLYKWTASHIDRRGLYTDPEHPCVGVTGVVVIPTVERGMSNQRMRIIQDLLATALLRTKVAVVLPKFIYSRSNCHYRKYCMDAHKNKFLFWEGPFDRDSTLKALGDLGFCVIDTKKPRSHKPEMAWSTSIMASGYERMDGPSKPIHVHLGDASSCCANVIPNTKRSEALLNDINAAFKPSLFVDYHASTIVSKMNAIAQSANESGKWISLHWRGEEDMVQDAKLDQVGYLRAIKKRFLDLADEEFDVYYEDNIAIPVLVLGDNVGIHYLENELNTYMSDEVSQDVHVKLYKKESLFPLINWQKIFKNRDDVKGQVDFEAGARSPIFVGSPYSSFSALIALERTDTKGRTILPTYMINADVISQTAKVLAAQLPYAVSDGEAPFGGVDAEQFERPKSRCVDFAKVENELGKQCVE